MKLPPTRLSPRQAIDCLNQVCRLRGEEFRAYSSAMLYVLNRLAAAQSRGIFDEWSSAFDQLEVLRWLLRKRTAEDCVVGVFESRVRPSSRELFAQIAMPAHGQWRAPVIGVGGAKYCIKCHTSRQMVERGLCVACLTDEHRQRCGCSAWKAMEDEIKRRERLWKDKNCCSV